MSGQEVCTAREAQGHEPKGDAAATYFPCIPVWEELPQPWLTTHSFSVPAVWTRMPGAATWMTQASLVVCA